MQLLNFFAYIPNELTDSFQSTYTNTHALIMISFTLVLLIGVLLFSDKLKKCAYEPQLRKVLGWILILNVLSHYIWLMSHGEFYGLKTIPIMFCPLSALFLGYILIKENYTLFPYVFYMGILGGFLAIIFTDILHAGPTYYRFYNFFIQHITIVILPIYLAKAYNKFPTLKDTINAYWMTLGIAVISLGLNYINNWETRYSEMNPYMAAENTPLEAISKFVNQNVLAYSMINALLFFIVIFIIYLLLNMKSFLRNN
ncbi:MAG: YwaF family protein [Candidatus Izimaplasma sp.]|nr:YwaF family protein [Candidatus Izimaplasma bacterium]